MGFFGGDNEPSRGEQLADQQYNENKAELERKRQNLTKTKFDIIKSQGGQKWEPEKKGSFPFGGNGFLNR